LERPTREGEEEIALARNTLVQDTAITADEPAVPSGPMFDALRSIASADNPARIPEEVNR
jgi:hypothetical protein